MKRLSTDCLICNRIAMIKDNKNPYFVAELETGYVVIGDHQYFKGYTLFLCKEHKNELHQLDGNFKKQFLYEMSLVSEAVYRTFQPDKLNYEMLGNGDAHMHWHIFPRRNEENQPRGPVWWTDKEVMYSDAVKPGNAELAEMKNRLITQLNSILSCQE